MRIFLLASVALFASWQAPSVWSELTAMPAPKAEEVVRAAWQRDPARAAPLAREASLACLARRFGMPSPFIAALHADTNETLVRGIVEQRPAAVAGDVEQRILEALRALETMDADEIDEFTRYATLVEEQTTPLLECTMSELGRRLDGGRRA